ncbi:MAG: hypothetical protein HGA19_23425 [Oscillochloris sp.]|nr:hypothetical protein [Oscillochloris sp.]
MIIPNADRAIVDIRKLQDYCLSPAHPRGRHKARVFAAVLGITTDQVILLRDELLRAVQEHDAMLDQQDAFGQRYVLDFHLQGSGGSAIVRSSWIIRTGEDFPRLTSCYVLQW